MTFNLATIEQQVYDRIAVDPAGELVRNLLGVPQFIVPSGTTATCVLRGGFAFRTLPPAPFLVLRNQGVLSLGVRQMRSVEFEWVAMGDSNSRDYDALNSVLHELMYAFPEDAIPFALCELGTIGAASFDTGLQRPYQTLDISIKRG